jgi:predicted nuclease with TOPRIM domain
MGELKPNQQPTKELTKLNNAIAKKNTELNELGNRFNELNRKYESVSSQKGKLLIRRGVFPK